METRLDRYGDVREAKLNELRELIDKSKRIVFLGGAGMSTESGIPDFRSGDGLYNQDSGLEYRAVDVISHSFFMEHPEEFFDFYRRKLLYPDAKPNKGHKALVRLERQGKLMATITQNIDRLHQAAGSKNTIELHGSVFENYCMDCGKKFKLDYILSHEGVPHCDRCGGIVRPDMTLYEENLKHDKVDAAIKALKKCDLLIIGGTSLTVYPAATFCQFIKHDNLVIINKSHTYLDLTAKISIHDSLGDVLDAVIPKRKKRSDAGKKRKKTTSKKSTAKKTASTKTSTSKTTKNTTSKDNESGN